jgi:error-prone DNA polymerase
MQWAAILLPDLVLDAVRRSGADPDSPIALIDGPPQRRIVQSCSPRAREAGELEHGSPVRYAGLVLLRQQPATASGVTFVTLEDETGTLNAIVWRDVARKFWRVFRESSLLAIDGVIERHDGVQHLVARRLQDYSPLLDRLDARSRDFR